MYILQFTNITEMVKKKNYNKKKTAAASDVCRVYIKVYLCTQ